MNPNCFSGRLFFGLILAAALSGGIVRAQTWGANSHPTRTTASHGRRVIGYITQWDAWKTTSAGLPVQGYLNHLNIDYSQYTHLNFCFFGVADDGSLHSGDFRNQSIWETNQVQWPAPMLDGDVYSSWDYWILYGDLSPQWNFTAATTNAGYLPGTGTYNDGNDSPVSIVWTNTITGLVGPWPIPLPAATGAPGLLALAHTNGVKVMASVGGWSMCKHYSATAASPTMRTNFVNSCKHLMAMGFDGIDFDWEYPGPWSGMNFTGTTADYTNFLTLIQQVRTAIGTNKQISVCLSANPTHLTGFNWAGMAAVVDSFNLMTYDFQGGWSLWTGHNAPLYDYPNEEGGPGSAADCVQQLIAAGVPRAQIAMGVPFYGRGEICTNTAALNVGTVMSDVTVEPDGPIVSCADLTHWPSDVWAGVPNYSYLITNTAGWKRSWDTNAEVPYLVSGDYFLSYDDSHSVGLKAQYARNQNIGGVIVWNVFGDLIAGPISNSGDKLPYSPTNQAPLINVVNSVLAGDPVPADGTQGPAPATVVLNAGWLAGSGKYALNFSGPNTGGYHILMTTNLATPLTNWSKLTSGTFGMAMVNYTNTAATGARQYYRISSP